MELAVTFSWLFDEMEIAEMTDSLLSDEMEIAEDSLLSDEMEIAEMSDSFFSSGLGPLAVRGETVIIVSSFNCLHFLG